MLRQIQAHVLHYEMCTWSHHYEHHSGI